MTEAEYEKLVELGDKFLKDLATAAGEVIGKFPPGQIRHEVKVWLQDNTSLYSPYTADMIDKYVRNGSID